MPDMTLVAAVVLAILTPLTIILVRHEIRLRRIRLIDAFRRNFGAGDQADPPAPEDTARALAEADNVFEHPAVGEGAARPNAARPEGADRPIKDTSSFEFVLSKYAADLDACPKNVDRSKLRDLDLQDPGVDAYISGLRWYQLRSNWRILWASLPYMLCCFFGFLITFWPLNAEGLVSLGAIVAPVFPTNGGLASAADSGEYLRHFHNVMAIAAVAFLGAYLYTLRTFVRAVTVFDLSAITMLRAAVHVLLSVAGVVLLYRALPSAAALLSPIQTPPPPAEASVATIWFVLAFVFGFVPDSALQFLFAKATQVFSSIKTMDDRFGAQSKSVPLDVIDGIDFSTRYRLEEANIFEVQNLACANPIMLHIETPYGIYQTIDWVAQAQLCTVVGPERFLVMRQHHIRTIFDLERAVLSHQSTPELRRFVALLLLMPTAAAKALVGKVLEANFPDLSKTPPEMMNFDALSVASAALITAQAPPTPPDATLEHLVRIIVDDLHVHRLRQIWMVIALRLGGRAASLRAIEDPNFYPRAA